LQQLVCVCIGVFVSEFLMFRPLVPLRALSRHAHKLSHLTIPNTRRLLSSSSPFPPPPSWWQGLSPVTKGLIGGVAIGVLLIPFGKVLILVGIAGGIWYLLRPRRPPMANISPFGPGINPFVNPVMGQMLKMMVPNMQRAMIMEKEILRTAQSKIQNNRKIKDTLGQVIRVHGPISQNILQVNSSISVQVHYEVVGSRGPARVVMDMSVDQSNDTQTLTVQKMELQTVGSGFVESVSVLDDEEDSKDEIIIDSKAEEVRVKPVDKNTKSGW
jgi:hypothetical protein